MAMVRKPKLTYIMAFISPFPKNTQKTVLQGGRYFEETSVDKRATLALQAFCSTQQVPCQLLRKLDSPHFMPLEPVQSMIPSSTGRVKVCIPYLHRITHALPKGSASTIAQIGHISPFKLVIPPRRFKSKKVKCVKKTAIRVFARFLIVSVYVVHASYGSNGPFGRWCIKSAFIYENSRICRALRQCCNICLCLERKYSDKKRICCF